MSFLYDYSKSNDEVTTLLLYFKLRTFKYINILYFLAHLFHSLVVLFKVFQYKYVDITTIGSLIKTQIKSICMLYVVISIDLNQILLIQVLVIISSHNMFLVVDTFKDIQLAKFHSIDMIRDPNGADLEQTLNFQKSYAEAIYKYLEKRFSNDVIVLAFKILNSSNMLSKKISLNSLIDLELSFN